MSETFGYDPVSNITSRETETWSNSYVDSASYTNHRRTGWTYDADGRIATIDARTYTYDAAGRNTQLAGQRWTPSGYVPVTATNGFEGEGRKVREQSDGSGFLVTSYYLRSTVLGGAVVEELNNVGQKQIGYVYLPSGDLLATQYITQNYVMLRQVSPGGSSQYEFFSSNTSSGLDTRREFDPMGANVRLNPGPTGHAGGAGDMPDTGGGPMGTRTGAIQNPAAGCSRILDGVPVPCEWINRFSNSLGIEYRGIIVNKQNGPEPVKEPFKNYPLGLFGVIVPNADGDGWHYELINIPQTSTCADFVDKLLSTVQGPAVTGSGTQANAGRLLARWADGALKKQAKNNPSVVPSGFKAKYVDGGQNLFAPVHIAGVAGGTLIGDNPLNPTPFGRQTGPGGSTTGTEMVKVQFAEDNAQLQWGLSRQKMGFTTTGIGGQPIPGYAHNTLLTDFIAEKHAELEDDGAGVIVGRTLERMLNDRNFNRADARREIFGLLCDR